MGQADPAPIVPLPRGVGVRRGREAPNVPPACDPGVKVQVPPSKAPDRRALAIVLAGIFALQTSKKEGMAATPWFCMVPQRLHMKSKVADHTLGGITLVQGPRGHTAVDLEGLYDLLGRRTGPRVRFVVGEYIL